MYLLFFLNKNKNDNANNNNDNELLTNSHYPKDGRLHFFDKITNNRYLLARTLVVLAYAFNLFNDNY